MERIAEPVAFVAQLEKITIKKNGDGQVVLNIGCDSLPQIQKLQDWAMLQGMNLGLAVTPVVHKD